MHASKYTTLAWYPILAVGLSMASFIMIKTGRDGVFFQENGLRHLPMAYVWIATVAVPSALLHLGALGRWGARKTQTVLFYLTAVLFLMSVPFADTEHRINALSLAIPRLVALRLQAKLGLGGALLLLPAALLGQRLAAGCGSLALIL
ncbi:hypothetical protein NKDENANG_04092 [Candidatus Entotheonellaceae bacterium PAL068K]